MNLTGVGIRTRYRIALIENCFVYKLISFVKISHKEGAPLHLSTPVFVPFFFAGKLKHRKQITRWNNQLLQS